MELSSWCGRQASKNRPVFRLICTVVFGFCASCSIKSQACAFEENWPHNRGEKNDRRALLLLLENRRAEYGSFTSVSFFPRTDKHRSKRIMNEIKNCLLGTGHVKKRLRHCAAEVLEFGLRKKNEIITRISKILRSDWCNLFNLVVKKSFKIQKICPVFRLHF